MRWYNISTGTTTNFKLLVINIIEKIHCIGVWLVCEIGIINPLIVTKQSPSGCCVI